MTVVLRRAVIGGRDTAHANDRGDALAGEMRGRYVKSFNPDAYGGRGHAMYTDDITEAKQFADAAAALAFWKTQSTVKPLHPDGKPNRPLTAYNVFIEQVPGVKH